MRLILPRCPNCQASIPFRVAMKTPDALMFPDEGCQHCPQCQASLVPTGRSIAAGLSTLLLLVLAAFLIIPRVAVHGMGPAVFAGLLLGLFISLTAVAASTALLRFDPTKR